MANANRKQLLERAAEARELARRAGNDSMRQTMLKIAELWERLAQRFGNHLKPS
jgi:hypothetical protein